MHHPLLVVAWFTNNFKNGDGGGAAVDVGGSSLPSSWESTLGADETTRYLTDAASVITRRHPLRVQPTMDPAVWVDEGFELRTQVYSFAGAGTEQQPAVFLDAYTVAARNISLERAATAAYRLAEFLNARLK